MRARNAQGIRSQSKFPYPRGTDTFKELFRKVRSTGEPPSAADIVSVPELLDNDLTLDSLSRS